MENLDSMELWKKVYRIIHNIKDDRVKFSYDSQMLRARRNSLKGIDFSRFNENRDDHIIILLCWFWDEMFSYGSFGDGSCAVRTGYDDILFTIREKFRVNFDEKNIDRRSAVELIERDFIVYDKLTNEAEDNGVKNVPVSYQWKRADALAKICANVLSVYVIDELNEKGNPDLIGVD